MPIIIVLLSTIVAFLFGGPLLAVAVLLVGLIIVFPNIFGTISAVIGVLIGLIGLIFLSQKFDIDIDLLFVIIPFSFLVIGGILTIMDNPKKKNIKEAAKKSKIEKEKETVKKSMKVLENAKITCNIVDILENRTIKYSINPNTDSVWNALCDFLIYRRENANNIVRDLKSLKIKYALTDEEINLNRNEKEIFLILKNVKEPPYFVPHTKESQILKKQKQQSTKSVKENVNNELKNNHIDNLVKLSNLYKDGLITEEEYQKEKKKILV